MSPRILRVIGFVAFAAFVVFVAVLPAFISDFKARDYAYVGIYLIALLGLNVLTGYTGQISLGHGAFMAIGIFGQSIYVNPVRGIVIVQASAWASPIGEKGEGMDQLAMFEAIAAQAGRPKPR